MRRQKEERPSKRGRTRRLARAAVVTARRLQILLVCMVFLLRVMSLFSGKLKDTSAPDTVDARHLCDAGLIRCGWQFSPEMADVRVQVALRLHKRDAEMDVTRLSGLLGASEPRAVPDLAMSCGCLQSFLESSKICQVFSIRGYCAHVVQHMYAWPVFANRCLAGAGWAYKNMCTPTRVRQTSICKDGPVVHLHPPLPCGWFFPPPSPVDGSFPHHDPVVCSSFPLPPLGWFFPPPPLWVVLPCSSPVVGSSLLCPSRHRPETSIAREDRSAGLGQTLPSVRPLVGG